MDIRREKINRKADKEFEFFGLQGVYFNALLIVTMVSFVLLLALGNFVGLLFHVGIPVGLLLGGYFGLRIISNKYGVQGFNALLDERLGSSDLKVENSSETYKRLS